ncbi:hypothetical protein GOODEAATRI_005818 [Goodea atripinnis]|uniref:Ion transport domain-containing protein n=1 Tax=Goodea atripinnis TaxID=208336 RepID=A0ABV0N8D4_9TELE
MSRVTHLDDHHLLNDEYFGKMSCLVLSYFYVYRLQPQELTDILEISNMVFTSLFSLEMLLKVLALGIFGYIKNPYNGFDSIIVIIRWGKEDWNAVLYNGMASTSPLAALYFVALMTFGNYVLFNLLVAILVEGFQAEGDANKSEADDERQSLGYQDEEKLRELYAADALAILFSVSSPCVDAELKIRAMMLSPNGLLNPKASMPHPAPPPLPVITHTAATPTINSSQPRRPSGVSMEVNSLEQRSLGMVPTCLLLCSILGWLKATTGEMESLLSDMHTCSTPSSKEQSLDQSDHLQVPMLLSPDCNGTTFHLPELSNEEATSCYHTDNEEEETEEAVVSEGHKSQDVRSRCPAFHFSELHHHSAGEA